MLNKTMLNKNRLCKCTIVTDKQQQKRKYGRFQQCVSSKNKSNPHFTVVGLNKNREVYIVSSKFSEPMRFAQHLNIVEEKYIQEQQPN